MVNNEVGTGTGTALTLSYGETVRRETRKPGARMIAAMLVVAVLALLLPRAGGAVENKTCKIVMGNDPCVSCCNTCCERRQQAVKICTSWWYRLLCAGGFASGPCGTMCLEQAREAWVLCADMCTIDGNCDCLEV